jgi:hypothetical protein
VLQFSSVFGVRSALDRFGLDGGFELAAAPLTPVDGAAVVVAGGTELGAGDSCAHTLPQNTTEPRAAIQLNFGKKNDFFNTMKLLKDMPRAFYSVIKTEADC